MRMMGDPMAAPMCLFIMLTLEEETAVLKAELQQCCDMLYCHGCSLMQMCILFQLVPDNGDGRVNWD